MFIEISSNTQTYIINTDQIIYIVEDCVHFSETNYLKLSPESMKELTLKISSKSKGVKNKEPDQELLSLFNELHRLVKGKGKVTFTGIREKKLKDLLDPKKHRMTKEDLIRAATNIGNNEWLQGDNPNGIRYGKIDFLLRPEKAQQYAEVEEKKKKGMF